MNSADSREARRAGDWLVRADALGGFLRGIGEVEILLVGLAILYLVVSGALTVQRPALLATVTVFAATATALRAIPASRVGNRLRLGAEVAAMVAFITAVLVQTEFDESPLVGLYLLPIIICGITLGRMATLATFLLVAGCLVGVGAAHGEHALLSLAFASRMLGMLTPFLLVGILITLLAETLKRADERIRELSATDELTGLPNLRALREHLAREEALADRHRRRFAVLMLDLDGLKRINDTYGHAVGNKAIQLAGGAIQRAVRSGDLVARFGGDEFVAVLMEADRDEAARVAQRIRNLVYAATLETGSRMERIDVSVGAAVYPQDGTRADTVLSVADRAMYQDKKLRRREKHSLQAAS